MIYSVWVPDKQIYKYYQDTKGVSDDGPVPSARNKTKIGCAPCDISWKVPTGAIPIGFGENAKGVVVHPGGMGDIDTGSIMTPLVLVGLLYIGYRFIFK